MKGFGSVVLMSRILHHVPLSFCFDDNYCSVTLMTFIHCFHKCFVECPLQVRHYSRVVNRIDDKAVVIFAVGLIF